MNKGIEKLNRINYGLGFISTMVICFAVTIQVIYRFVFNGTFNWVDEVCQVMIIFMTFFEIGQVEQNDEHITMELVYTFLPKYKFHIQMISKSVTLLFIMILFYSEIMFFPSVQGVLLKASYIPVVYVHYVMVYGMVVWFISTIYSMSVMCRKRKLDKGVEKK